MLVDKTTKRHVSCSIFQDEYWVNEFGLEEDNVFIVKDGTNLADKIKTSSPYMDFVLDAEGNLIDITPTERPPEPIPPKSDLELLKEQQEATASAVDFLLMNRMM